MLDILKRLEAEREGDDDEGGGDELIDRLAGLDLGKLEGGGMKGGEGRRGMEEGEGGREGRRWKDEGRGR